uniref:Putative secreted protein n=1 Tax=Anopheles triannulatus TaxID=58253 RepID=A0A2M4B686_9DIPT
MHAKMLPAHILIRYQRVQCFLCYYPHDVRWNGRSVEDTQHVAALDQCVTFVIIRAPILFQVDDTVALAQSFFHDVHGLMEECPQNV